MSKASKQIKREIEAAKSAKTPNVHIKLENWLRGANELRSSSGNKTEKRKV